MNIREIESQLGIPRANIRYYEKEGLLHPARSGNNYRVYTDEDVETLKKIRLLRQLDMPIETIRAVQSGDVSLHDAVSRQLALLESSAARLERAQAVCRAMLEDQTAYPALDPARYENPAALPWADQVKWEEPPQVPPVEGAVWAFNPWQRFWARMLDMGLADLAITALLALVFHLNTNGDSLPVTILETVLCWGLVLVLEPLLLSTLGTTPGKWLMGLELRDKRGRKLSFSQAFQRTWDVLGTGYGYQVPFYNIYRHYQCWKTCRENKPLYYDWNEGNLYYSRTGERWGPRGGAVLNMVLILAAAAVSVWVGFQAELPPNRGDITPAEFFENVNFQSRRLGYNLWLDEEGYELADQTMNVSTNGGPVVHYVYGEPFDDEPVYRVETDENGFVTAVTLEQEEHFAAGKDGSWVWLPANRVQLAVLAFCGTRGSGWELTRNGLTHRVLENLWAGEASTDREDGFTLTAELEQEGYGDGSSLGTLLIPRTDGGECWYRFTMRLEMAA